MNSGEIKKDYYKCNPIDFCNIVSELDKVDYFMNVDTWALHLAGDCCNVCCEISLRNIPSPVQFICSTLSDQELNSVYAYKD